MKPVHFRKLPKLLLSRAIVSFLLVIVLVACGTNAVTTSSPAQPHPSSPANISENASTSLNLNPANISIKTGNVLIQSRGFDCPDGNLGNAYYEDQLVLASDRMTYSQDEITQMRSYVLGSISAGTGSGISKYATVTPSLPTLHWVLGGNNVGTGGGSGNGCGATLNVTNTGNTPIQIPEISIQVKASPQPNTYHYRLIDACSFLTPEEVSNGGCLPTGSAGGGPCNLSSVSFQLGSREKNQCSKQAIQFDLFNFANINHKCRSRRPEGSTDTTGQYPCLCKCQSIFLLPVARNNFCLVAINNIIRVW